MANDHWTKAHALTAKSTLKTIGIVALTTSLLMGCSLRSQGPTATTGYGVPAADRTLAQRILDTSIHNTAMTNINAIDPTLHRRSRIGLDSFYSEVLLTGEVPDDKTKQQILTIVQSMPDIKKVHDGLTIGPQKGKSYTVHDGYITSKINSKIVANPALNASHLKVVTDDGVVYVLGKLTPTQRGHLLNVMESTVGIRRLELLTELVDINGMPVASDAISQEEGLAPPQYVRQPGTGLLTEVKNRVTGLIDDGKALVQRQNQPANYSVPTVQAQTQQVQSQQVQPQYQVPVNQYQVPVTQSQEVVRSQGAIAQTNNSVNYPIQNSPVQAMPNQGYQNQNNQNPNYQNQGFQNQVQQPPIVPRVNTGNSPYIEMYKNQVSGWQ